MGQYLLKDSWGKGAGWGCEEKGQESTAGAWPRLPRTALSKGSTRELMCLRTARSGKGRTQIKAS